MPSEIAHVACPRTQDDVPVRSIRAQPCRRWLRPKHKSLPAIGVPTPPCHDLEFTALMAPQNPCELSLPEALLSW